jgi:hypothetical protein
MADRTSYLEPAVRSRPDAIENQLWPTVCATLVLVGILGVVVWQSSDFEDDRLLLNGYTHLAALGLAAGLIIFIASRLKGAARRTAELAIVFSLAFHAVAAVTVYYLFGSPMSEFSQDAPRDALIEAGEEPPPPDYHWGQNDEQEPEQAFEKSLATKIREQARPDAELKPRNVEKAAQEAEIKPAAKVEVEPLEVAALSQPSRPLEIARPEAAKIEEAKTPEAQAMARHKADSLSLPTTVPLEPVAVPQAPGESSQGPGPVQVKTGKLDRIDWATVGKMTAPDEPLPPPHKIPRGEPSPGETLPSPDIIARLPTQAPPQRRDALPAPDAADRITDPGRSFGDRHRDGVPIPSTVIPDAGLQPQSPPSPGSSAPARLEAASTIAVEKSDLSRAPLGPSIASNGAQDWGAGSHVLPARRGSISGRGTAQPAAAGNMAEDLAELRSGSPASDLSKGMPLASASARRAIASQPEDDGSGRSSSMAGGLPRTQSELHFARPATSRIVENSNLYGAGGIAASPGGQVTSLDIGPKIAIRRFAGTGSAADSVHHGGSSGAGDSSGSSDGLAGGDAKAVWPSAQVAAAGLGTGPRRIVQGMPDGDDAGLNGISRARGEAFSPRPVIAPVGPAAGVGNAAGNGAGGPSGPTQRLAPAALEPHLSSDGIARRENAGQDIGSRASGQAGPPEIGTEVVLAGPQSGGRIRRGPAGDGPLDPILSGDGLGVGGAGHESSLAAVSGQVREPMAPFRRGAVHGGLTLGDSLGGQLTEPAIENGLEYFSHSQFNDGHWSLHASPEGASDPASMGSLRADTAATGLALLSYLAAGYTHQDEKYRDVVRRGVDWLVKHQQEDGNLAYHGSEPGYDPNSDPTNYYSHGIAAIALCEAYGMTQDRTLRGPAQKAIDFIVKSQDPSRGGWRYIAQQGSDTSVTGWQLMALKSAQMAGLEVPAETLQKVGHWLDLAQVPNRGTYVYNPWNADDYRERAGRAPSPTMTAQAMIMRMYLGQDHDEATLAQGADYLLAHLPEAAGQAAAESDCYYWYYATQAMYHMQGDYWKTWDARVTPLLRAGQVDRGPLKGSWNPREPVPDRWRALGGRHYVTSIHVLTLEFRYWHLPLFRELRRDE